ncbi:putative F-box/LRR-repeat protein At1g56400 [Pyrus communis]|uniref:putative F-box/LRR-repeat protein At1g56400 n=1 Tax=Pyrus communis TaxID=23211 RepID=UPI0035C20147
MLLDSKCDYNSRKRKENKYDYNLADRISELTDELLVSLLTLLPLKEAAATSILSKRWQYVLASTRTLNFDAGKTLCSLIDLNREEREQKICKYVDWVNSVVEQHTWPNVEQFRVAFDLDDRFSNSINKWIQFALKKKAQVLELDFSEDGVYRRRKPCYQFPHELLGIERGSTTLCSPDPLLCRLSSFEPPQIFEELLSATISLFSRPDAHSAHHSAHQGRRLISLFSLFVRHFLSNQTGKTTH